MLCLLAVLIQKEITMAGEVDFDTQLGNILRSYVIAFERLCSSLSQNKQRFFTGVFTGVVKGPVASAIIFGLTIGHVTNHVIKPDVFWEIFYHIWRETELRVCAHIVRKTSSNKGFQKYPPKYEKKKKR